MLNDIQMAKLKEVEGYVRHEIRNLIGVTFELTQYLDEVLYNGEATTEEIEEIGILITNLSLEETVKMGEETIEMNENESKELKEQIVVGVKELANKI